MNPCTFVVAILALPQLISGDIVSDITAEGDLNTLLEFVGAAGLVDAIASNEPVTIFAPTDDAFAKLPSETVAALKADPELLKNVLLYHVVLSGAVPSTALAEDNVVETATGSPLRVNVYKKGRNGEYVVVTANGKRVIKPDVFVGAGSVVHKIDEVLPVIAAGDNIAAVLSKDEGFSTLVAAASAADLVGALQGDDKKPLTVFAPTNEAFAELGNAVNDLLADKPALTKVLLRHVAPGALFSKGLCWQTIPTLNEEESLYSKKYHSGRVFIKNIKSGVKAEVVEADIVATNGVIHRINKVL